MRKDHRLIIDLKELSTDELKNERTICKKQSDAFLSGIYQGKCVIDYDQRNFDSSKEQLLELLDKIIEIDRVHFSCFSSLKENIDSQLTEDSGQSIKCDVLTEIKQDLELAFKEMHDNPTAIVKSVLESYEIGACFPGARDNIKLITGLYLAKTLKDKLIQAKKETLLQLAVDFIGQNNLLPSDGNQVLVGYEIHYARWFYNTVCERFGLQSIVDGYIPNNIAQEVPLDLQRKFMDVFVSTSFDYVLIVRQFILNNPAPIKNLSFRSIQHFLESIGAQPSTIDQLYESDLDENNLPFFKPKKDIALYYNLLVYDLLVQHGLLEGYQLRLSSNNLTCDVVLLNGRIWQIQHSSLGGEIVKTLSLLDEKLIADHFNQLLGLGKNRFCEFSIDIIRLFDSIFGGFFDERSREYLDAICSYLIPKEFEKFRVDFKRLFENVDVSSVTDSAFQSCLASLVYKAVEFNLFHTTKYFIKFLRNPNNVSSRATGDSLLHIAVRSRFANLVLLLADACPAAKNLMNKDGCSPLFLLCLATDWTQAELNALLTVHSIHMVHSNSFDRIQESPLFIAIQRGDEDLLKTLLDKGANPNFLGFETSGSPIDYSSNHLSFYRYKNRAVLVQLLMQYDAQIPLHQLCGCNDWTHVELNQFASHPGRVSFARITTRNRPLSIAIVRRDIELIRELLAHNLVDLSMSFSGYSIGRHVSPDSTYLLEAVNSRDRQIVKLLLENHAVFRSDRTGYSPLTSAVLSGDVETAIQLIECLKARSATSKVKVMRHRTTGYSKERLLKDIASIVTVYSNEIMSGSVSSRGFKSEYFLILKDYFGNKTGHQFFQLSSVSLSSLHLAILQDNQEMQKVLKASVNGDLSVFNINATLSIEELVALKGGARNQSAPFTC